MTMLSYGLCLILQLLTYTSDYFTMKRKYPHQPHIATAPSQIFEVFSSAYILIYFLFVTSMDNNISFPIDL